MKIYLQVLTFSITLQTWLCHVLALLTTEKKWTKMKNARAALICDVLVAVAVVVAKAP